MPEGSAGLTWEIQLNRVITEPRYPGKGNRETLTIVLGVTQLVNFRSYCKSVHRG